MIYTKLCPFQVIRLYFEICSLKKLTHPIHDYRNKRPQPIWFDKESLDKRLVPVDERVACPYWTNYKCSIDNYFPPIIDPFKPVKF